MQARFLSLVGVLGLAGCAPSLSSRNLLSNGEEAISWPTIPVRCGGNLRSSFADRKPNARTPKHNPDFGAFSAANPTPSSKRMHGRAPRNRWPRSGKANPVFLCGLERIEFLGDEALQGYAQPQRQAPERGLLR
jgi:hypothetical protein